MPIYEYRCEACGHELEALQKMSDNPLVDCPACQAPALRKQVSAAAFKLTGTGWYETDFKNSGKQAPAKGQDGKAGDSGADSSGGSSAGAKPSSDAGSSAPAKTGASD